MDDRFKQIIEGYAQPVPTPPGVTSREIVRRAIEFGGPPRIPYSFIAPFQSDFFEAAVLNPIIFRADRGKPAAKGETYRDEWGVGQKVTGRSWDTAFDYPLKDLHRLDDYRFPEVLPRDRLDQARPFIEQAHQAGKYVIGFDPVMMYERARSLMGFEELMIAPYTQPEGLKALLERLADLTIDVIGKWGRAGGVDGFMTWEDWGLQTNLQMKIETFRQFYKPVYARIVEAAHRSGLHYIWHNCGQIMDMIPDMIDIGVDVVQLDQPRLMGHRRLTDAFGGRICFWNTVDIQWSVLDEVSGDDLRAEVKEMIELYGRFNGGFMARQYPQPRDIDLSGEKNRIIAEAFFDHGCA